MSMLDGTPATSRPVWMRNSTLLAASLGAALLALAWCMLLSGRFVGLFFPLAGLAALLSGSAYALNARPRSGRLLGFGNKYVQVRSLDEWTLYQYGIVFEESSPEQQNEALTRYRVGLDPEAEFLAMVTLIVDGLRFHHVVPGCARLVPFLAPGCLLCLDIGVYASFQTLH